LESSAEYALFIVFSAEARDQQNYGRGVLSPINEPALQVSSQRTGLVEPCACRAEFGTMPGFLKRLICER
jgi:hypothetical protein